MEFVRASRPINIPLSRNLQQKLEGTKEMRVDAHARLGAHDTALDINI
jgi:hypothetical protein